MSQAPWNLAQANYAQIKEAEYEVAVLPLGAPAPQNLHLTYNEKIHPNIMYIFLYHFVRLLCIQTKDL